MTPVCAAASSTGPQPPLVHVDAAFVVADKPAGLLAVPGRGPGRADCLWSRVRSRHADALVVHRLDMATSGLIVYARGVEAQRALSRAFAERRVNKAYVAVVDGLVEAEEGVVDLPLAADWPNRPRQQVDAARGRPSLTRFRVLARHAALRRTRVELEPVTGRAHQLRVHLAAIGHPIVGDALYAPPAVAAAATRLLLHASRLGFEHPHGGGRVGFESEPPF
jgi:tRNA pseudouridine32 synthase/23S rRNA pseudouridine746 synthase